MTRFLAKYDVEGWQRFLRFGCFAIVSLLDFALSFHALRRPRRSSPGVVEAAAVVADPAAEVRLGDQLLAGQAAHDARQALLADLPRARPTQPERQTPVQPVRDLRQSGARSGPANPGRLNNSLNDPSGAGNAAKTPYPPTTTPAELRDFLGALLGVEDQLLVIDISGDAAGWAGANDLEASD